MSGSLGTTKPSCHMTMTLLPSLSPQVPDRVQAKRHQQGPLPQSLPSLVPEPPPGAHDGRPGHRLPRRLQGSNPAGLRRGAAHGRLLVPLPVVAGPHLGGRHHHQQGSVRGQAVRQAEPGHQPVLSSAGVSDRRQHVINDKMAVFPPLVEFQLVSST